MSTSKSNLARQMTIDMHALNWIIKLDWETSPEWGKRYLHPDGCIFTDIDGRSKFYIIYVWFCTFKKGEFAKLNTLFYTGCLILKYPCLEHPGKRCSIRNIYEKCRYANGKFVGGKKN